MLLTACAFDTSGLPNGAGADGGTGAQADAAATTSPDAAGRLADARTFPSPDARTTTPPDASMPGGTWQNILRNSGFESVTQFWSEQNNFGYQIIADEATYGPARTGNWAAWFGGIENEHATLGQDLMMPFDATAVRVRGWIYISTENTGDADKLELRLEPAGFSPNVDTVPLISFRGTDAGSSGATGWIWFEAGSSNAQPGERLRLVLESNTNNMENALFVVDDLELQALVP